MTIQVLDREPLAILPTVGFSLPAMDIHLSQVMNEMERRMAEYVDPRHLDPFNVPQTVDLTLEVFLEVLPGIEPPSGCQELWTTIIDTGRLILTSISVILSSLAIGLTASITLPMLGVALFVTSTVLLLASIGGTGLWWMFSGESSRTNHRMDLLRDLRMNKVISQEECWELRKELTNKWKFRECLGRLVGKLTYQRAIEETEHRELVLHLNKGTWSDIDQVLEFLELRIKAASALSRQVSDQSVWSPGRLQFIQEQLQGLSETGDWSKFLYGESSSTLKQLLDADTIANWLDGLIEVCPGQGLERQIRLVKTSLREEGIEEFKAHCITLLQHLDEIETDTAFLPLEQKQSLLGFIRKALEDRPIENLSTALKYWASHHEWYEPIEKLMSCLPSFSECPVEVIKDKVDAYAKGYLCFLLEQANLGGCSLEEGKKYYELFFNKWWNQTMFELIIRAPTFHKSNKIAAAHTAGAIESDFLPTAIEETPVLALISYGGGGHVSAANSVKSILETQSNKSDSQRNYSVEFANAPHDIFGDVDIVEKFCSFFGISNDEGTGPLNGEDFYNRLLQGGHLSIANYYTKLGRTYYSSYHAQLEKIFEDYLDKRESEGHPTPKLIISNMPLINGIVEVICKKRNIPFLVTTTDLNTSAYVNCINYPENDFGMFKYSVAFPDFSIFSHLAGSNFKPQQIEVAGFPLRPEFFDLPSRSPESIENARKSLQTPLINSDEEVVEGGIQIPEGKKVIALSMGSQGSVKIYSYLDKLLEMENDFHLVVLCGKDAFKEEVEGRYASHLTASDPSVLSQGKTMTVLGPTKRVAGIMSASHVFLGKPGGNTSVETIYAGVPFFSECTAGLMENEEGNSNFMSYYELGSPVENIEDLPNLIRPLLESSEENESSKEVLRQQILAVMQDRKFTKNFPPLVEQMLVHAEKSHIQTIVEEGIKTLSLRPREGSFLTFLTANQDEFETKASEKISKNVQESVFDKLAALKLKDFIELSPSFKSTVANQLSRSSGIDIPAALRMMDRFVRSKDRIGFEELESALERLRPIAEGERCVQEVLTNLIHQEIKLNLIYSTYEETLAI